MVIEDPRSEPAEQAPSQRADSPEPRKRSKGKMIAVVVIVIVVVVIIILAAVMMMGSNPEGGGFGTPWFRSVTHTPEHPLPSEQVTITVEVVMGNMQDLVIIPAFAGVEAAYSAPFEQGDGNYVATVGPFPDGTEVWYIVEAIGMGPDIYSFNNTFMVGNVERSAVSTLSISNIVHNDVGNAISVGADITSDATITEAHLVYYVVEINGDNDITTTIGGSQPMPSSGDAHTAMMPAVGSSASIEEAHGFFRIVAVDDAGNTAASEPVHIIYNP